MGSICGGGGNSSNANTTTNQSSPPPQTLANYEGVVNRATAVANTPWTPYPGEQVAPLSNQTLTGLSNLDQYAYSAQPYLDQAGKYTQQGAGMQDTAASMTQAAAAPVTPDKFSGDQLNQYMNPYTKSVIDATQAEFNNQNSQQAQFLNSQNIGAGAFGGDRAGLSQSILANQQNLAQAPVIAGLNQSNFNQALAEWNNQQQTGLGAQEFNRQQAGQMGNQYGNIGTNLGNIGTQYGNIGMGKQTAGMQGAQGQIQAGMVPQTEQQAIDTSLKNTWNEGQAYPFQTTGFLSNVIQGIGSQTGGTAATTTPAPSAASQALGAGTAVAGLALDALPFLPYSDARLKENVVPIGKTFDGQTIHRYNFKGDPRTQIGLVAQEVERRHPEAVHEGLSGLKQLDYNAATRDSEGRDSRADGGGLGSLGSGNILPGMSFNQGVGTASPQGALAMAGVPGATAGTGSQAEQQLAQTPAGTLFGRGQRPVSTGPGDGPSPINETVAGPYQHAVGTYQPMQAGPILRPTPGQPARAQGGRANFEIGGPTGLGGAVEMSGIPNTPFVDFATPIAISQGTGIPSPTSGVANIEFSNAAGTNSGSGSQNSTQVGTSKLSPSVRNTSGASPNTVFKDIDYQHPENNFQTAGAEASLGPHYFTRGANGELVYGGKGTAPEGTPGAVNQGPLLSRPGGDQPTDTPAPVAPVTPTPVTPAPVTPTPVTPTGPGPNASVARDLYQQGISLVDTGTGNQGGSQYTAGAGGPSSANSATGNALIRTASALDPSLGMVNGKFPTSWSGSNLARALASQASYNAARANGGRTGFQDGGGLGGLIRPDFNIGGANAGMMGQWPLAGATGYTPQGQGVTGVDSQGAGMGMGEVAKAAGGGFGELFDGGSKSSREGFALQGGVDPSLIDPAMQALLQESTFNPMKDVQPLPIGKGPPSPTAAGKSSNQSPEETGKAIGDLGGSLGKVFQALSHPTLGAGDTGAGLAALALPENADISGLNVDMNPANYGMYGLGGIVRPNRWTGGSGANASANAGNSSAADAANAAAAAAAGYGMGTNAAANAAAANSVGGMGSVGWGGGYGGTTAGESAGGFGGQTSVGVNSSGNANANSGAGGFGGGIGSHGGVSTAATTSGGGGGGGGGAAPGAGVGPGGTGGGGGTASGGSASGQGGGSPGGAGGTTSFGKPGFDLNKALASMASYGLATQSPFGNENLAAGLGLGGQGGQTGALSGVGVASPVSKINVSPLAPPAKPAPGYTADQIAAINALMAKWTASHGGYGGGSPSQIASNLGHAPAPAAPAPVSPAVVANPGGGATAGGGSGGVTAKGVSVAPGTGVAHQAQNPTPIGGTAAPAPGATQVASLSQGATGSGQWRQPADFVSQQHRRRGGRISYGLGGITRPGFLEGGAPAVLGPGPPDPPEPAEPLALAPTPAAAPAPGPASAPAEPAMTSLVKPTREKILEYNRSIAPKYGNDPEVVSKILGGEMGAKDPYQVGDAGSSFGPWQLHKGGINPAMSKPGMGDEYFKATGHDPNDPKYWQEQSDFAQKGMQERGVKPWATTARALGLASPSGGGLGNSALAYQGAGGGQDQQQQHIQYQAAMDDAERTPDKKLLPPGIGDSLIAAGAAMMAGKDPHFMVNVGEGIGAGLKYYQAQKQLDQEWKKNEAQIQNWQADARYKDAQTRLETRQIDIAVEKIRLGFKIAGEEVPESLGGPGSSASLPTPKAPAITGGKPVPIPPGATVDQGKANSTTAAAPPPAPPPPPGASSEFQSAYKALEKKYQQTWGMEIAGVAPPGSAALIRQQMMEAQKTGQIISQDGRPIIDPGFQEQEAEGKGLAKGREEGATQWTEEENDLAERLPTLQTQQERLADMETLMRGKFSPGAGAEEIAKAQMIARRLGIDWGDPSAFYEAAKVSSASSFDIVGKMKGQVRNMELQGAGKQVPGPELPLDANLYLLNRMRGALAQENDYAQALLAYRDTPEGQKARSPNLFRAKWYRDHPYTKYIDQNLLAPKTAKTEAAPRPPGVPTDRPLQRSSSGKWRDPATGETWDANGNKL